MVVGGNVVEAGQMQMSTQRLASVNIYLLSFLTLLFWFSLEVLILFASFVCNLLVMSLFHYFVVASFLSTRIIT